ncbi:hypothetical protein KQI65_11135 [bacterium]|nr:hypothetical protein [bacterium]
MHRVSMFALMLLFSSGLLSAQTVSFSRASFPEGMKISTQKDFKADIIFSVGGSTEGMTMSKETRVKSQFTILEEGAHRFNKAELVLTEGYDYEQSMMRRKPKNVKLDDADKVFIVEANPDMENGKDNPWLLSLKDGSEVTDEESSFILDEVLPERASGFVRMLDGRTMSVGDTANLDDSFLQALGTNVVRKGAEIRSAYLLLREVGEADLGETATFDIVVDISANAGMMDMNLKLKGTVLTYVESLWPLNFTLKGDMGGESAHGGQDIVADGLLDASMVMSYEED